MTDPQKATRQLQALTRLLYNQPTPQRALAEAVSRLRVPGITLHTIDRSGEHISANGQPLSADEEDRDFTDSRRPLIAHLKGKGHTAVVVLCPSAPYYLGARAGDIDHPVPHPGVIEQRLRADVPGSAVMVGREVLAVWAPMALTVKLARDLAEIAEEKPLPGHVFFVFAPQAATGGPLFERTGVLLSDLLRRRHLHPIAALAPGPTRLGAGRRRESANRRRMVITGGNHGVATMQLMALGIPSSAEAAVSGFDATYLLMDMLTAIRDDDRFRVPKSRAPLPQPTVVGMRAGRSAGIGHQPAWAAAEVHLPFLDDGPGALLSEIKELAFDRFAESISKQSLSFERFHRAAGLTPEQGLTHRPAVTTYADLKQVVIDRVPPVRLPQNRLRTTLEWAYEQSRHRVLAAYENSPLSGRPLLVIGLAPPMLPPVDLPHDDPVRRFLRREAKRVGGAFTRAGGGYGAFQRIAINAAPAKLTRPFNDESILPTNLPGFGLVTAWPGMRLIGYGPVGEDHGMHTERVLVDPSFTRLPGLLRTIVYGLLDGVEDRPLNLPTPSAITLDRAKSRLGAIKRRLFRKDDGTDDEFVYATEADHHHPGDEYDDDYLDDADDYD